MLVFLFKLFGEVGECFGDLYLLRADLFARAAADARLGALVLGIVL